MGSLGLCLCHMEARVLFLAYMPKVWTLKRIKTSDLWKVTQDICIPTKNGISAYDIYEIYLMPML